MSVYNELKQKYSNVSYNSYSYTIENNKLNINYNFEIENLCDFNPTWSIDIINDYNFDYNELDSLVFSLGMVELLSYYKAVCSPNIIVKCHHLTNNQINWWKKLYINGLGEFLHINHIDSSKFDFNIKTISDKQYIKSNNINDSKSINVLVPIGGGKDSVVSIELLKKKFCPTAFIINPRQATLDTYTRSKLTSIILSKRVLDPKIKELNDQGFLNGHTPFSAIVAFSSVIAAYINGLNYVALSNEASASESTIIGTNINHQYSKSYEFESDFNYYNENYFNNSVKYFSLLRGFSELKIASLFVLYPQYHDIFRSCNVGSFTDTWCSNCSKCLFVYIILSPFLTVEELYNIFNKNLLDDKQLLEDFRKLIGLDDEKPFECVGAIDEINASIQFTINNYKLELPYLLTYYNDNYNGPQYNLNEIINKFNQENDIPLDFIEVLK